MTEDTAIGSLELGCAVVLDPDLRVWQRRFFHQPATGPGRRAFTARRAQRGWPLPARFLALTARWDAARNRETAARGNGRWL